MPRKPVISNPQSGVSDLLGRLRDLIGQARRQALRAVDLVQVSTSWEVGRHIVEFEQGGRTRAAYGSELLAQLGERLTAEFGKGFDASNLYKMTQFYRLFPNLDALRLNLSWTHYRLRSRVQKSASSRAHLTLRKSQPRMPSARICPCAWACTASPG